MSLNAPNPPGRADPLIGMQLAGRYRVERVLEKGGAGIIYYATHEGLGKPAAVKVLSAAWSTDDTAVERFQREARAASHVGHRNIIDVYDMGVLDDGRPWLVMQWLEGQELGDLLEQEGVLDPWLAANIVLQAGSALDAVHAKSIVHRDIKPENFFLHMEEDGTQVLKLLDFGLAAIQRPGDEAKRLTRQGVIHGTPHYMAPEATGNDLPDHRADVYSLAVVAFEMLTGELPFDSDNPMQILTLKLSMDPPTMAERTGKSYPEELERTLAWGLARDPNDRAQSAGHFAEAFAEVVRTTDWTATPKISGVHPKPDAGSGAQPLPAITATPGSIPPGRISVAPAGGSIPPGATSHRSVPTMAMEVPKRPWLPWLLVAALLAALAGLGIGGIFMQEPEPRAARLDAAEPDPEPELDPAPEPEPEPEAPEEEEAMMAFSEEEANAALADPGLEDAPQMRVRQRSSDSRMRRSGADQEPDPSLAPTDRERAQELAREATQALLQNRYPDAIRLFREATQAHPGNARAWRGLGLANERLGRAPEAVRAYERYLRVAPRANDVDAVRERIARLSGG